MGNPVRQARYLTSQEKSETIRVVRCPPDSMTKH